MIIKSIELKLSHIQVQENWSLSSTDSAHLLHCIKCEPFEVEGLFLNKVYGSLAAEFRNFILTPHNLLHNDIVLNSYNSLEKIGGEMMRGNAIGLSNSKIECIHFKRSLIFLETSNSFTITNSSFFEVRGGFVFVRGDSSLKSTILRGSSFVHI